MTHSIHFESSCIVFHLQSQFRFDNESVATLGEPAARVNQCHCFYLLIWLWNAFWDGLHFCSGFVVVCVLCSI